MTSENTKKELLSLIAADPGVLTGKPVISGTRLTVDFILNLLAHGATEQEILQESAGLESKHIRACLLFASQA